MRRARRAWRAVGIAGDTSFLVASIGGVATLGAIGAGLLAGLTAVPLGLMIVASTGLVAFLGVVVPLGLSRIWTAIAGPQLSIGDWSMKTRLHADQAITEAGASVWNARDAGGERACAKGERRRSAG